MRKTRIITLAMLAALLGVGLALASQTALAEPDSQTSEKPATESSCNQCHNSPGLSMTLAGGETMSLYVDSQAVAGSVHGDTLYCESCHLGYTYPHKTVQAQTVAEYEASQDSICKTCHPNIYSQVQSSVHASLGDDAISCLDCHGSHAIQAASATSLRATTLALCTGCHEDPQRMDGTGIPTTVVTTYLSDFHGRTSLLLAKDGADSTINEAVCMDCHGTHSILSVDSPDSQVVRANLITTCQKCHQDATPNFPASWMAHYEPTVSKTPLVFFSRLFYWLMIPFTVVGLLIHIGLDVRHHVKAKKK